MKEQPFLVNKVGSTHPTGMLSCFMLFLLRQNKNQLVYQDRIGEGGGALKWLLEYVRPILDRVI